MHRLMAVALVAEVAVACTSSSGLPKPEQMVPSSGALGQVTSVRILGQSFFPVVRSNFDDEAQSRISTTFIAALGAVPLQDVSFVSTGELRASVPGSLTAGPHDLTVTGPGGTSGVLAGAFTVGLVDAGVDGPPQPEAGPRDAQVDLRLVADVRHDRGPDSKGGLDVTPGHDTRPGTDTKPGPDIKPWPDIKPGPDLKPWKADTVLLYVGEDFTTGWGAVSPKTGTWSVADGAARQMSTSGYGLFAVAKVPAANYIAETMLTIHSIASGQPAVSKGAGLSVRVQAPASPNAPGQYQCFISADQHTFSVVLCSGTQQYCPILKSTGVSFAYNTPYVVRATVIGNGITCEMQGAGSPLSIVDSTFPTGDVALSTFMADASFDYLTVRKP